MTTITRRTLLKGALAFPIAMTLPRVAGAQELLVRYDLASPEGAAMLDIYAQAAQTMQAMGPENPMSWMWQWYHHFVSGATNKTAELDRIFGIEPSPLRTLAEETWNTCQSHAGQNPHHFLPWHRLFVYYFERIVRHVSGRPEFTLPYWDYTSSDLAKRGIVPWQFRRPTHPLYKSLYRAERSSLARTGQPIHKNQPVDVMNIDDLLLKPDYQTRGRAVGFCRFMDAGIHSRIHGLVGTARGMGRVPYAGRDPLFWVHHANVDRMWASWVALGRIDANPTMTWAKTRFVFADVEGARAEHALLDVFDMATLGYTYDNFLVPTAPKEPEPEPPTVTAAELGAAKLASRGRKPVAAGMPLTVARAQKAAVLSAGKTEVALVPDAFEARLPFIGLDPAQPNRRTYLVLENLHAWSQPEVLFHVYVRGAASQGKGEYAGNINFFDAEFHDHGKGRAALNEALGPNFYSFDVTAALRRMARSGAWRRNEGLVVSIIPAGVPTKGSNPMVATIELARQ